MSGSRFRTDENPNRSWDRFLTILFWGTVFIVTIIQYMFVRNSNWRIGYEELAESIRNPYLFANRYVYDGVSSNVGWYAFLSGTYRIFGFQVFLAKYVRFAFTVLSLFCLALSVRKWLKPWPGLAVLLTVGLSPTLLYFNTLAIHFGIDLMVMPVVFCIGTIFLRREGRFTALLTLPYFLVLTVLITVYPVFVFYLPAAVIFPVTGFMAGSRRHVSPVISIGGLILGVSVPWVLLSQWLRNAQLLWYDPATGGGVMRGGGSIIFDIGTAVSVMNGITVDLLFRGKSYYLDVPFGEFSFVMPAVAIALSAIVCARVWPAVPGTLRRFIILLGIGTMISIIASLFTIDRSTMPGVRRVTPLVVFLYALYFVAWKYQEVFRQRLGNIRLLPLILLMVPLHHLAVLPANFRAVSERYPFSYDFFIGRTRDPEAVFRNIFSIVEQTDAVLPCRRVHRRACDPDIVYSAIAANCLWNRQSCHCVFQRVIPGDVIRELNFTSVFGTVLEKN